MRRLERTAANEIDGAERVYYTEPKITYIFTALRNIFQNIFFTILLLEEMPENTTRNRVSSYTLFGTLRYYILQNTIFKNKYEVDKMKIK